MTSKTKTRSAKKTASKKKDARDVLVVAKKAAREKTKTLAFELFNFNVHNLVTMVHVHGLRLAAFVGLAIVEDPREDQYPRKEQQSYIVTADKFDMTDGKEPDFTVTDFTVIPDMVKRIDVHLKYSRRQYSKDKKAGTLPR